jgi:DNA-binding CsgD family transcriptional regulator
VKHPASLPHSVPIDIDPKGPTNVIPAKPLPPLSGASPDGSALEALAPDALRLMTLALHANGRLDVRTLSALMELMIRGAWSRGFRQALGQQPGWSPGGALCGLSPRELAVLRLVAIGRNNEEIGRALSISRNTVASHLRSILGKTFTANRTEAAAFAYREGLLAATSPASEADEPPGQLIGAGERAAPTAWTRVPADARAKPKTPG